MKTFLTVLALTGFLASFCSGQDSVSTRVTRSNAFSPASTNTPAAYYTSLNHRMIELKACSELLSQLAQEHRKLTEQTAPDHDGRARWESDLAKEFSDKALAFVGELTNLAKERLTFERDHPDVVDAASTDAAAGTSDVPSPDESVFLGKLEERLATVQQELGAALEAGELYAAQLATNSTSTDFSRIAFRLQENATGVKQLQKEVSDLELRKLEFRALRRK